MCWKQLMICLEEILWMSGMDDRRGAAWSACVVPKTTTGTDEDDQRGLIGRVRGKTPKSAAGDLCPVHDLKTDCGAMIYFGQAALYLGTLVVGFPEAPGEMGSSEAGQAQPAGAESSFLLGRAHKPADPLELARVCGTERGFVEVHGQRVTPANASSVAHMVAEAHAAGRKALYRINRDVSLSRAIGDWDLKEFGVIATPDVTVYAFDLSEGGSVGLAMATGGVWDVLDCGDVAALLEENGVLAAAGGAERTKAAEAAAAALVAAAYGVVKNNDDVTAVVASFELTRQVRPSTGGGTCEPKGDSETKEVAGPTAAPDPTPAAGGADAVTDAVSGTATEHK